MSIRRYTILAAEDLDDEPAPYNAVNTILAARPAVILPVPALPLMMGDRAAPFFFPQFSFPVQV